MPEDKITTNTPESIPSQEVIQKNSGRKIEKSESYEKNNTEELRKINNNFPLTEPPPGGIVAQTNQQSQKKEREKKIEHILEDGLDDLYINLPPNLQVELRVGGEKASNEINNILDKTKIKIKKIITIIKEWLSVIPSVNKFFLEQTAKIKADEIMKLKNHE